MGYAQKKPRKEWRCKYMKQHMAGPDRLAVPCKECRSIEVTEKDIPLDLSTIQVHSGWITWDESFRKYI